MFDAEAVSRNFIAAGGKLVFLVTAGPLLLRIAVEAVVSLLGGIRFSSLIAQVVVIYVVVVAAYGAIVGNVYLPGLEDIKYDLMQPFVLLERALNVP